MTQSTYSEALESLANGLALCDGFEFDLLIVHSSEQLQSALQELKPTAEALREEPLHFHLFGGPAARSLPRNDLIHLILAPLLEAPEQKGGQAPEEAPDEEHSNVYVIDATAAGFTDEGEWAQFFRRMNLLRNNLAYALDGPLILALPRFLEDAFTGNAPDFWSIRTTVARLPAPKATQTPKAPRAKLAEVPNLTILHISGPQLSSRFDKAQMDILEEFFRDLRLQLEQLKPDLVCLTGPLTDSASLGQFNDLERFVFFPLINELQLSEDRFFWTPSGSDSARNSKSTYSIQGLSGVSQDEFDFLFKSQRKRTQLLSRFTKFMRFAFSANPRQWSSQNPCFAAASSNSINGIHVGVASINSAWLSLGSQEEKGQLKVSRLDIEEGIQRLDEEGALFRIALMHHPISWLHPDSQEVLREMLPEFDLLLTSEGAQMLSFEEEWTTHHSHPSHRLLGEAGSIKLSILQSKTPR